MLIFPLFVCGVWWGEHVNRSLASCAAGYWAMKEKWEEVDGGSRRVSLLFARLNPDSPSPPPPIQRLTLPSRRPPLPGNTLPSTHSLDGISRFLIVDMLRSSCQEADG